jgi:hypothetical protein
MQKEGSGTPIIWADLNGVHLLPPSDQAKLSMQAQVQVRIIGKQFSRSNANTQQCTVNPCCLMLSEARVLCDHHIKDCPQSSGTSGGEEVHGLLCQA